MFTYSIKRARQIRTFHVAVVQRRLRNVQKSVMSFFFCFAFLPLPSSLLKLHIAVIQKFCSHGNVTSHFSFLFQQYFSQCSLLLIAFPNKWMHLKWKLHRCNYRCNYRSQVNYRCSTNTIFLFLSLCLPPSVHLYSLIICPSRCDYCNIIKTICICNVCICH